MDILPHDLSPVIYRIAHWVLATVTFTVLCIAALHATLLALQDRKLHRKKLSGIVHLLPPLETMEKVLSYLIILGFILLTLVLLSSAWFFSHGITPYLLEKMLITFLAWIIFAVLLWGRYTFGWRGRVLTRWTLGGALLTILLYFSSIYI